MGETKEAQRKAKAILDEKLQLSVPECELLENLAVKCASEPSSDNTFQYAFAMSKSSVESELRYAITILDGLVKEGYAHQADCMYGSATAHFILQNFEECRSQCEAILRSHPNNRNAAEMHLAAIEGEEIQVAERAKKIAMEGTIGMAVIGLVGLAASVLLKRR